MIYVLILFLSFGLTYYFREYALSKSILDHPNERSSHDMPTPRAGGLAIIFSFYIGLFYLYFVGSIEENLLFAFLSATPLIVVSFLDDLYTLSAQLRFIVQVFSVCLALYFIGSESIFLNIFFFFGMLWLINLFNFLDGIDGYAVSEALFVSFASYLIFDNPLLLVLGFSVLGFLPFNWQRASIFMGDVGSTFLGFSLSVFVVYFSKNFEDLTIWLILLALFWVDATWILYRRFRSGESITKAHNSHFFQRAVKIGFSHQRVVLSSIFINLSFFALVYIFRDSIFLYLVLIFYIIILYMLGKFIDKKVLFR